MQHFDSIVIGAGHNGLVCAAYLARQGQKVLVLEAADRAGGLAATREFHPGFQVSVAHSLNQFSAQVAADLELSRFGYVPAADPLPTIALHPRGEHVHIQADAVEGASAEDAARYPAYRSQLQRFAEALAPFWMKTMPAVGGNSLRELLTFAQVGLKLRLLGKDDLREFFRIAALPARDLMDENFDNESLKAALGWEGLIGSRQAPRSPNNTMLTMLYRMSGDHGGAHSIPAGGIAALINALVASATESGVELRCSTPVAKMVVREDAEGLRVTGVELSDGERLNAERVISATDPQRTFLQLLGPRYLEIEFTNRMRRLRCEGNVAKLHLALSGLPTFTGLDSARGRLVLAADMDAIEFAWDDAKYGQCSASPVMEIVIPSLADSNLAPEGQHVLSAHVMYVPYDLHGGWNEAARDALLESLLSSLEQYAPGLRELVIEAQLLTPLDLEQGWNVSGGHWHHGELAMDQMLMMRPTYGAAQYRAPVDGLYLCSAGCHPGGGIMGAAGHNAAVEILK